MSFFKKLQLSALTPERRRETKAVMTFDNKHSEDFDLFNEGVSKPRPFKIDNQLSSEAENSLNGQTSVSSATIIKPSYRSDKNSGTEINSVLEELLLMVKEVFDCHSTALYWINRNKHQFVLESAVTDSKFFNSSDRINFNEKSILDQVMNSSDAVTKFNFPSNELTQLLPYYLDGERVNSFLGLPVLFNDECCAVLVVDSLTPSAFAGEDIHLINRLGKIISSLVNVYSRKDENEFAVRFNDHISGFISELQRLKNIKRLNEEVADVIGQTFEFQYFALVLFDATSGHLRVQRSINKGTSAYIEEGARVSVDNSLVGSVMKSLKPVTLRSTESFMDNRFRFNPDERIRLDASLICVPVYSSQKCYGAIILEYEKKGWYTAQHIQSLDQIGFITGLMLENIFLDEVVESHKVYDELTGVFDKNFFFDRMRIELGRASRVGFDCCYLTFELDDYTPIQQKYGKVVTDLANSQLAQLLKVNLRNYDYIGRATESHFVALMPHSDANNAFLLAEKIREHVASSPLKFDKVELPITLSIGISRLKKEKPTLEAMVDGSLAALRRAQETGGNNVKTT